MRKNYPISMKIPGAHLQMVSNECANFQKNPCTHFLEHAWTKSCPQTGDRQTDRQAESNISPKLRLGGGYNKTQQHITFINTPRPTQRPNSIVLYIIRPQSD